jgi:Flp pilus assembly protein TadD
VAPRQIFEIACREHKAGRFSQAEALYRQILKAEPSHSNALHHLGLIAHTVGNGQLAVKLIRRSLELCPNNAVALGNLGEVYRTMGCLEEAVVNLRSALALQPNFLAALTNLGRALADQGEFDEAVTAFRHALGMKPGDALLLSDLGFTLVQKAEIGEALIHARQAVEQDSNSAQAQNCLGVALTASGQCEEALAAYHRAIELRSDDPEFHWNLAIALLSLGHMKEGWEEYEWRVKRPHLARADLTMPAWNGEDLSGRTLLLHQEGGFGDALQFIRYLPMVLTQGVGRIIFEGNSAILPLMKLQPGIAETVERDNPLPVHDFHCSLQSLPRIFGTELNSIPASIPYLPVDQEKQGVWRRKLSAPPYQDGNRRPFLVGICWAGSPLHVDARSRTLETFAPLAEVAGVIFISLQKGNEARQSSNPPPGMKLLNAAAEVEDFSDLAALISRLDAVVTVDTSVGHLAGALGVPTSILIPRQPDFRWLLEREDSPWYPTVRLFRQQDFSSWEEPVQRMVIVLRQQAESLLRSRTGTGTPKT